MNFEFVLKFVKEKVLTDDSIVKVFHFASEFFEDWKIVRNSFWISSRGEPCFELHLQIAEEYLILKVRLEKAKNGNGRRLRVMEARLLTKSQKEIYLRKEPKDGEDKNSQSLAE